MKLSVNIPAPVRPVMICAFIFIGCAYLATAHLDYVGFWDDEAIQAFIARNLVLVGDPVVFDGRNFYTNDGRGNTSDINADLYHRYPQLIYYLGAATIYLFGDDDKILRFICALFGLAAMLVFYQILIREFGRRRPILICAAFAVICFSPMLLLHIRSFQYYAPGLFFNLLMFYAYLSYRRRRNWQSLLAMTVAAMVAFHAHYLVNAAFVAAVAITQTAFYGNTFSRRDWLKLTVAGIIWAGGGAWYLLQSGYLAQIQGYASFYKYAFIERHVILMWQHLRALNENDILPWTIMLWAGGAMVWRWKKAAQPTHWRAALRHWRCDKIAQYAAMVLVFVILIGALTPDIVNRWASARYSLIITPFAAVISAAVVEWCMHKNRISGVLLLFVLISSNIVGAPFLNHAFYGNRPIFTLPAFIHEIHNPYPNGIDASLKYMQEHAAQDDVVFVRPHYYANSLRYYLGDRLLLCCMLGKDSPLHQLFIDKPYLFWTKAKPDWIISYGGAVSAEELATLQDYHHVAALPVFEIGISLYRPEPAYHLYSHSIKEHANAEQAVFIYRRNDKSPPNSSPTDTPPADTSNS